MSITNRLKITISPIRLHSASSLQIPRSTARFNSLLPSINVSPLKLHSVSSINLYALPIKIFSVITLELDFLQLNLLYFLKIRNSIKGTVCTLIFLSAMPRVAPAAII